MVFLDKIWDDTLAGPAPETGLKKLRKYHSFSSSSSSGVGGSRQDSRIKRPNAPSSLGGVKRLVQGSADVSPIVCDWIVISALDG